MKKKILLIVSMFLVLCVGVAIGSYTTRTGNASGMSCCCCSGDSCPLKNKDEAKAAKPEAKTDGAKSCCDKDPGAEKAKDTTAKESCCSCCSGGGEKKTS